MKSLKYFIPIIICCFVFSLPTLAQQTTTVTVRAQAKDAKFIGDGMGGAMIVILEAATGDTLARGLTKGSTGDTQRLVKEPVGRYDTLHTPGAAAFKARLAVDKPTLVIIQATAPEGEPHAKVTASKQLWVIPGKNITGDGIILEIPGFVINNRLPETDTTYRTGEPITIQSHIVMMCGCPTSDGGLWDSSEYEIKALVNRGGKKVKEIPLSFTGETNLFETTFEPAEPGRYTITVYAFHPQTANAGVAETEIAVQK